MAKLILVDKLGTKIELPAKMDAKQQTIFAKHLEQGKSIGQCNGHGICKGCLLKIDQTDAHKFVEVVEHPHNLQQDERLACCTSFEPSDNNDEAEVSTPRNFYLG